MAGNGLKTKINIRNGMMKLVCLTALVATWVAATAGMATAEVMQRRDWKVEISQGSAGTQIDLDVPAFHEIAPRLSLAYDSSIQGGWLGAGWALNGVSRIERVIKGRGVPKYETTDVFLLDGQELIPCATGSVSPSCTNGGTHSTKMENYFRIALSGSGTTAQWTITAKDGKKMVYTPSYLVSNNTAVFKWGLSQVIDTKGNTVTYKWANNLYGCCWEYPDAITYNGTTVKFYWESRADNDWGAIGSPGFSVLLGRLKTIDVSVNGSRVRAYRLTYTTSGPTSKSLLTSVQQFGKDATLDTTGTVTGGTSLPATTFGYQTGNTSFVAGALDTGMQNDTNSRFVAMDINGDGKGDMLELKARSTAYSRVTWLSNGTGFTKSSESTSGIAQYSNSRFLAADVNGDGKSDFVELRQPASGVGKWVRHIWISNGTGFASGTEDSTNGDYNLNVRHVILDVNGDGKSDMLELYRSTGGLTYLRATYLSNGTKFTLASTEDGIAYDPYSQFFAMDVNGDSKADMVEVRPNSVTWERRIWISNGSTGFTLGTTDNAMPYNSGSYQLPADINGDGKTDMLELFPYGGAFYRRAWLSSGYAFTKSCDDYGLPADNSTRFVIADVNGDSRDDFIELYRAKSTRRIWLSTGSGKFTAGASDLTNISSDSTALAFSIDINGDGLQEMVDLYPATRGKGRRVWPIAGPFPDLLSTITNEGGATTTVSYTPSSAWANTNNPPIQQTVTKVVVTYGNGGTKTTTYSYAGGLHDTLERRFLGFRYEKETLPCNAGETTCPYIEKWFRQDYGAASKAERLDYRTGSGTLLKSSVYEYTTNGATVPWTSLLSGEWEYTYIGTGAKCPGIECKRKYTNRTFNAFGEATLEVNYGDYDTSGDEVTTPTTYVPNTTAYIVNKPADVKVYQGTTTTGTLLNETLTYYDGATQWNAAPSAGLPTKEGRWLSSPSSFVETKKEYDAWGNITAEVNALGARTTFTFDTTYHQFKTSETNALNQSKTTTWDPVCGVPTKSTNLNNQSTTLTYDALCRLSQKTEPGGKYEKHTWANLGNPATQYEQVERPPADGTTNPLWQRTYFDGLGRTWREVSKGPDTATGDIYVDTVYNARGQEASKTLPCYWVSGAAQPTTYAITYTYDALDRLTKKAFADGASQSKSYGLWSITETDELGRSKTDRMNFAEKRIGHDETVGGVTKTTSYVYDARQNLVQSTDPNGNVIKYTTDSLGRVTQTIDPDLGTWRYEFDAADRLTAQTDGKGQRTTFTYDALDRKLSKTTNAGTTKAVTVTWTYDQARTGYYNVGALTTLTDPAGTKTIDLDVTGHEVKITRTIDGRSYTFLHGFDAGDRQLWTTYPDGTTLGTPSSPQLYDSAGRLKSIPGYVTKALYNAEGKLTGLTYTNGAVTTRTYSPQRSWLTGIVSTKGTTTLQNLAYTRNSKGLITKVTSAFAYEGWTYGYDELDRLTTATNTTSSTFNQTFAYDAIGNITSNSRLGTYTYGTRPHAPIAAGSNAYEYDAGGNMTAVKQSGTLIRTQTWDGDNRLATVSSTTSDLEFTYDADGTRIAQDEDGIIRHYLGDDYEVEVGGAALRYIAIAGTLVARHDSTMATFVHTDHLGSIQAETDATGVEVHGKAYRPYGEIISESGTLAYEPRGFTGQRHDVSGLVYMHARYYDPQLGRFISPDLLTDGEDTVGLNRYAYCHNDPINHTDLEGTSTDDEDPGSSEGGESGENGAAGQEEAPTSNSVNVDAQAQETGYWCGPASTRIALSAHMDPPSQAALASQLGTTENGTDWIGQITGELNNYLGEGTYATHEMPNDPASTAQKDQLWSDIVHSVDNGYVVVANIVAPPGNQPPNYPANQTIYHYLTVYGYDKQSQQVQIADPANFGGTTRYTLSFDQFSTLVPPKGYSSYAGQ